MREDRDKKKTKKNLCHFQESEGTSWNLFFSPTPKYIKFKMIYAQEKQLNPLIWAWAGARLAFPPPHYFYSKDKNKQNSSLLFFCRSSTCFSFNHEVSQQLEYCADERTFIILCKSVNSQHENRINSKFIFYHCAANLHIKFGINCERIKKKKRKKKVKRKKKKKVKTKNCSAKEVRGSQAAFKRLIRRTSLQNTFSTPTLRHSRITNYLWCREIESGFVVWGEGKTWHLGVCVRNFNKPK